MKNQFFSWDKSVNRIVDDLGFNKPMNLALAETSARYMNPFVPMRDGFLSQTYTTGVDDLGGYVDYTMPYARKQYNGKGFNFSKEMHPLATDHWDKYMMVVKGDQLIAEADRIRKRYAR